MTSNLKKRIGAGIVVHRSCIDSFVFHGNVIPNDDCKLVKTMNQYGNLFRVFSECPLFCTL
jgi:hypothetical protein